MMVRVLFMGSKQNMTAGILEILAEETLTGEYLVDQLLDFIMVEDMVI